MKKVWIPLVLMLLITAALTGQEAAGTEEAAGAAASGSTAAVTDEQALTGAARTEAEAAAVPETNGTEPAEQAASPAQDSSGTPAVSASPDAQQQAAAEPVALPAPEAAEPAAHPAADTTKTEDSMPNTAVPDTAASENTDSKQQTVPQHTAAAAPTPAAKAEASGTSTGRNSLAVSASEAARRHEEAEYTITNIPLQSQTPIAANIPSAEKRRVRAFSMHSGLSLNAIAANNVASIFDFFKPQVIIDIKDLAKAFVPAGYQLSAGVGLDLYSQFTVLEAHTFRFSISADGYGWTGVSRKLTELLGQGNTGNFSLNEEVNAAGRAFAAVNLSYSLKQPVYSFSAKASYFVPVVYTDVYDARYHLIKTAGGGMSAGFNVDIGLYSHTIPFAPNEPMNIMEIFKRAGGDITLSGSYRPMDWVDVQFELEHIPIVPAVMDKGLRIQAHGNVEVKNLLGNAGSTSIDDYVDKDFGIEPIAYDLPAKKVIRPCKLKLAADFRPFSNNYLIITPRLALPFNDAKPYYADAGFTIGTRFGSDVIGLSYSFDYLDRIWRHEAGVSIDSRWFSFNLAASVASHSFARTFHTLSGVGIKFGIGIGF